MRLNFNRVTKMGPYRRVHAVMAECRDFNYSVLSNILHLIRTHSAPLTSAYLHTKRRLPQANFQTLGVRPGETHNNTTLGTTPGQAHNRLTTTPIARATGRRFTQLTNFENGHHSRHSLAPRVNDFLLCPVGGFPTNRTSRRSRDTCTRAPLVVALIPSCLKPSLPHCI